MLTSITGHSLVTLVGETMASTVRAEPSAVLIFVVKLWPQPMCASSRKHLRPSFWQASKMGRAISSLSSEGVADEHVEIVGSRRPSGAGSATGWDRAAGPWRRS